jgi:hypothetical protein
VRGRRPSPSASQKGEVGDLRPARGVDLSTGVASAVGGIVHSLEIVIGGSASDSLIAGSASSVLMGGGGNDQLIGSRRNDILIGGTGNNRLDGGSGSDLLIGGQTVHDSNAFALADLLAEWSSGRSYQQRIDNLLGIGEGERLNGATVLGPDPRETIFGDPGSVNEILGGASRDWFIAGLADLLPDRILSGSSEERFDSIGGLSV